MPAGQTARVQLQNFYHSPNADLEVVSLDVISFSVRNGATVGTKAGEVYTAKQNLAMKQEQAKRVQEEIKNKDVDAL